MPKAIAEANFNPAVDLYIAKAAPFAQPILNHIRELMHQAVPDIAEEIKWSHPFFVHRGVIVANMAAFKQHASLGMWGTDTAKKMNEDGVATAGSMGSLGKLTTLKDLPPRKQLIDYVKHAAKQIEDGTRTKAWERPKKAAKPPVEVPDVLAAALKKDKVAAKNFAAFSPSAQREYTEWIATAKREATRDERLLTAIQWIGENKKRNWKYENC